MKKKSLGAKKTIHKSFLNHLKDSRVNKVFNGYKNNLDKFINKKNKIGAAISGGPDSLALAFLTKCIFFAKMIHFRNLVANACRTNDLSSFLDPKSQKMYFGAEIAISQENMES